MTKPEPYIAPIRTRLHVVVDRFNAGLPFYWHEPNPIGLSSDQLRFMGQPCKIIDRDGEHLVLQRDDERIIVAEWNARCKKDKNGE